MPFDLISRRVLGVERVQITSEIRREHVMSSSRHRRRNALVAALRLLFLSVLLITAITASARADLVVTIYSGTDRGDAATASGGDPSYAEDQGPTVPDPGGTMPYSAVISANAGGSSASTTVSLTSSSLDWRFNHVRTGWGWGPNTEAEGSGIVVFSVSQDTPYTFVGSYKSTANQTTNLESYLMGGPSIGDLNTFLFDGDYQSSGGTLTVGSSANMVSFAPFTGSLTGELYAGDVYEFNYFASIVGVPAAAPDIGGATGELTLYFGTAPVPEPGTLTLLISALLGLAGAFYLRRRRANAS